MAANAVISNSGSVVGAVVTFKHPNVQKSVFIYVDYTKGNGTKVTLTLASINPRVQASNSYQHAAFATATIAPITATFDASGRYRFEIPLSNGESQTVATFVFTDGDTQAVICDIYPN